MSKNGGYKIIDLRGRPLTGDAQTIPGIYEEIEGNYYKSLLLSGVNVGGVERPDLYTGASLSGANYTFSAYGYTITITADDEVTVN